VRPKELVAIGYWPTGFTDSRSLIANRRGSVHCKKFDERGPTLAMEQEKCRRCRGGKPALHQSWSTVDLLGGSRYRFAMLLARSVTAASGRDFTSALVGHHVDPFPGVARRRARTMPFERRFAALRVPIAFQLAFCFRPVAIMVLRARLPTVSISRSDLVVRDLLIVVIASGVFISPMMFLDRGINALGDFFAGQTAGNAPGHNPDGRAHRPGDGTSGGSGRRASHRSSNTGPNRVRPVLARNRIRVLITLNIFIDIRSMLFAIWTFRRHNDHSHSREQGKENK
jgi:hypothetical protein